jgi:hypothetical protein
MNKLDLVCSICEIMSGIGVACVISSPEKLERESYCDLTGTIGLSVGSLLILHGIKDQI